MSCSGGCCAVFYYPSTPDELRARVEAGEGHEDDPYIADMLIPLTLEEAEERAQRFGIRKPTHEHLNGGWKEDTPLYTCKHWNEETRLCSAYEERPAMCAQYPYGKICEHCGFCNTTESTPIDAVLIAY